MLSTKDYVEEALVEIAQSHGVKVTADAGRQGNVLTYRTYNKEFKLMGSVTVHFEESFASIVNYAGRDAGESFRYGDATHKLIAEVSNRLNLKGAAEAAQDSEEQPAETPEANSRKKLAQDAFPF